MEDIDYIDSICHKYFHKQKADNFRCNFRSYSRSYNSRSILQVTVLILQQEVQYFVIRIFYFNDYLLTNNLVYTSLKFAEDNNDDGDENGDDVNKDET